jgi:N utilization substance protein B
VQGRHSGYGGHSERGEQGTGTGGTAVNPEEDALPTHALTGRSRARAVAVQALYELDATSHDLATVIRRRLEHDATPEDAAAYASHLVQGVVERRDAIDVRLAAAAPAWPLGQMDRVDKSILRLAIFEMLHEPRLSPRVVINEAVELAKLFGHESSPRFVNGVLGAIERGRREERGANDGLAAARGEHEASAPEAHDAPGSGS